MAGRTRECPEGVQRGRLTKANEFFEAAGVLLELGLLNPAVTQYIDAGIAASDVICCVRLGVHSADDNHNQAVELLESAATGFGKHLRVLLALKNKVAYTHQTISLDECKRARRAGGALHELALRTSGMG